MNVNDNVCVIPFDKLGEWYKNENNRLYIPESEWRELEGKGGIVTDVINIDNIVIVAFPALKKEGSSNPVKLYFYEDTLEKVSFGQEE